MAEAVPRSTRPKQPMGRPPKLTPELQERIIRSIAHGNYPDIAAAAAGVSKPTFIKWLKRGGREESGRYHDFVDAVSEAEAVAEERIIKRIDRAGKSDWRADAWRAEHRFPDRWARAQRVKLEGEVRVNRGPDLSMLTTEELETYTSICAKALARARERDESGGDDKE
jgi:transposase